VETAIWADMNVKPSRSSSWVAVGWLPTLLAALGCLLGAIPSEARAEEPAATGTESQAAVESGRDALRGGWTGERYPWYDSSQDDLRRVKVQPPSDFWARFWRWLGSFDFNFSLLGFSFSLFQVIAYLLIAVLLGVLIYVLTRIYIRRQQLAVRAALEDAPAVVRVADIEALPPPVRQHVGELLARAMQLYQEGRYSEAIVYLFSHELLELDKSQMIRLARGKTNRQYLKELGSRRPLREVVERTMVVFEDAFFGDYTIDRARFESCWSQLDVFNRLVRPGGT
jgi:hypothetical protein